MADTEKFVYDVFVSYSSANKDWVRKDLLSVLEKAGLKVCIDFRDFKAGKPAIKNMRDSVIESKHTLLVLTEAYLNSGWTDFENMLSQTIDPANREGRIVPLLKEKCKLPLEIGYLTYVNFFDPDDWDIAWKQLFEALGKPDAPIPTSATPTPATVSRDTWHLAHPYPMPPNFTGRAAEQQMLDDWLADNTNRLFILRALGGFGKSALTWQWINTHVNPAEWTKLVWWSFYEGDASFEHFIEETLKYLNLDIPQGQRPQVDELLKAMQSQKILLIMDGFERALRAYSSMNAAYQGDEPEVEDNQLDCVNINAEIFLKSICSLPNIKSKVLMTTRLTPRTVKPRGEFMLGCREEDLTAMQKADAVEFFRKQKIKGTHAEIEVACKAYGYHPLSLRILAGLITNDREKPGDIAVADRLDITDDIIQNKNHVLKISYDTLSFAQQKLLSNMSCFRSSINYQALKFIASKPSWKRKNRQFINEKLDDSLHKLESRGLISWNRQDNKYEVHPIVRRYTYKQLDRVDCLAAHSRLRDYFATIHAPAKPQKLEEVAPIIELYHHTVQAGEFEQAFLLLKKRLLPNPLHFQLGAHQTIIELVLALFPNGDEFPPKLRDETDQGWLFNSLASSYAVNGQPRHAFNVWINTISIAEKLGEKGNMAIGFENMASHAQLPIGELMEAERNMYRYLELISEVSAEDEYADGYAELGKILTYQGQWDKAEIELEKSLRLIKHTQNQCVFWAYQALFLITKSRSDTKLNTANLQLAIQAATRSLELANEHSQNSFRVEPDYIRAYWLLGSAYRMNIELDKAEENLSKAIILSRQINLVENEANILLDLACLRYAQKNYEEAKALAEEALLITERYGYVLQGADVNLFLAQYVLEQEQDKAKAKQYAEEAKKLATCDGPPYYYKVAYEEAERMLASLKV